VGYAIGVARPVSVFVETFGTGKVADDVILDLINKYFELRPPALSKPLTCAVYPVKEASVFTKMWPLMVILAAMISIYPGKRPIKPLSSKKL
jgi:hypothetical protein